jgi:CO/xanthine dehydrogenase FAD-binding subunit
MSAYERPSRLDDALRIRARGDWQVLAGGTDHFPARVGRQTEESILDLTALAELRGIAQTRDGWRIGATTTWTELIEARLPPLFSCLKLAAREIGGVQIQNGVPALLALDASVELASPAGRRALPLEAFIRGPRQTSLRPDEIVTAVLVPRPAYPARSHFLKLGARKYLVISIVVVAAAVELEDGAVRAARVAVGACSPVARRLPALEAALLGKRPSGDLVQLEHLSPLAPIGDVRADAGYRNDAALVLLRRLIEALA